MQSLPRTVSLIKLSYRHSRHAIFPATRLLEPESEWSHHSMCHQIFLAHSCCQVTHSPCGFAALLFALITLEITLNQLILEGCLNLAGSSDTYGPTSAVTLAGLNHPPCRLCLPPVLVSSECSDGGGMYIHTYIVQQIKQYSRGNILLIDIIMHANCRVNRVFKAHHPNWMKFSVTIDPISISASRVCLRQKSTKFALPT